MRSAFEQWIGKKIVVQLNLGEMKVGLHGTLLKEGEVIVRTGPAPDGNGVEIEVCDTGPGIKPTLFDGPLASRA